MDSHKDLARAVLLAETFEKLVAQLRVHVQLVLQLPLTAPSKPLGKAPQRLGGLVRVPRLGPLLVAALGERGLVA